MNNNQKENNNEQLKKELEIKILLKRILTAEAFERLSNVKLANPELYSLAVQALVQLYSQTKEPITDSQLKEMLIRLRNNIKREVRIKRK
ncbi:MAG: hypothetical protein J7L14_02045 [Candidatus Diapherotrites archaeon]|nr:hypothetical protein [Candidatus Diapherotrites archaeon]